MSQSQLAKAVDMPAGQINEIVHGRRRELASVTKSGVEAWPGGEKELFIRIVPARVTGRRIGRPAR